ncbi:MAG: hypothetical protein ACQGVC_05465 [Myxococcota bacterium]
MRVDADRPPLVDRFLAPYVRDAALWPVTIVLLAHVVLGVGVAALDTWRSGMGWGAVSLGAFVAATLACWIHDARLRRFGTTSWLLLGSWAVGLACAVAADHYGVY